MIQKVLNYNFGFHCLDEPFRSFGAVWYHGRNLLLKLIAKILPKSLNSLGYLIDISLETCSDGLVVEYY